MSNTPESICNAIRECTQKATTSDAVCSPSNVKLLSLIVGKNRFFMAPKEHQPLLYFPHIKRQLLLGLDFSSDDKITQVVGDSARFSAEGTAFAKEFLYKKLNSTKNLILWGYTGKGKMDDPTLGVNQLVNNWIDSDPERATRTLANVVDHHTVLALEKWGCNIAKANRNFYLVYGDARFGDDVLSSDSITDVMICIEGGIQSFRQIVNVLDKSMLTDGEKRVFGVFNIRGDENPGCFIPETKEYGVFFSAGEFFSTLKELSEKKKGTLDSSDVIAAKDLYLQSHHLFNPHNLDASTKQALFDAGWKQFIDHEVWKKLHLCDFTKFQPNA